MTLIAIKYFNRLTALIYINIHTHTCHGNITFGSSTATGGGFGGPGRLGRGAFLTAGWAAPPCDGEIEVVGVASDVPHSLEVRHQLHLGAERLALRTTHNTH